VAIACPFIKQTLDTGGKGYSQSLWTYTVMLASYCISPEETAKRLSNGHEEYLEQETVDKVKYHVEDHKTNTKVGPPKCETFHRDNVTECKTCPHLKLKRSPLNVPGAASVANFKQPNTNNSDLPPGYYRGKDTHIWGDIPKKIDGVWTKDTMKVFPYPIKFRSAIVEPNCSDYHMSFITYEEWNREKEIILPYSVTSGD
jgi:hypothetical protein